MGVPAPSSLWGQGSRLLAGEPPGGEIAFESKPGETRFKVRLADESKAIIGCASVEIQANTFSTQVFQPIRKHSACATSMVSANLQFSICTQLR